MERGGALDRDPVCGKAVGGETGPGLAFEPAEDCPEFRRVEGAEQRLPGPREVIRNLRIEQAPGRKDTGGGRDQYLPDHQRLGHRGGEQRPVAAKGDERIFAGIATPLARHRLDCPDHVRRRDQMGAPGTLFDRHAERLRDLVLDGRTRLARVEPDRTADQMIGVDVTENDIGIRQGRLGAPEVVTDRTRRSAGAVRSDLQCPAGVDPDDRAAACPDFGQIDRRHLQCVAGARQQPRADHDAAADEYSRARLNSPFSISDALAVVPPMSNEIALPIPSWRASAWIPTTPAAGPLSMMFIGVKAAAAAVVRPPFDCISRTGASTPIRTSSSLSVERYRSTIGLT